MDVLIATAGVALAAIAVAIAAFLVLRPTNAKGIAAEIVKESGEDILRRVAEQLETHGNYQSKVIDGMVQPVQQNLEKVEKQINEMERKREGAYASLGTTVQDLAGQAKYLNDVLHSDRRRGQWAEQQLRNILELAGMGKHIDFDEQVTSSDNKARPDVVVKIPGGAKIPIDAKFPLVTDQEHVTDEVNDETRREYADRILSHAKDLGKRDYPGAVDAVLDFTVMFVPVTPILEEALTANPDLWDKALRDHQVLIATPWMLVAFLRTVSVSWQQDEMAKNTKEILKAGLEMLDRLRVYAEHVDKVGVNLRQAMEAHNSSVSSLEARVFPQAKRFEQYGVTAPKPIPELEQLDTTPKSFRAP